jgi:hypothetical protein
LLFLHKKAKYKSEQLETEESVEERIALVLLLWGQMLKTSTLYKTVAAST